MSAAAMKPSADEYRAAAALRASLRRFSQVSDGIVRRCGLTTERYELLLTITCMEAGGQPASVSALAAELGVAQVSVTQLVRRAEDAGLLRREVSPKDARVRYLRLTPSGEDRLGRAVASLAHERARLAESVGLAESLESPDALGL